MSKQITNYDLANRQFVDSFKENLKQVIYHGAGLLSCDELEKCVLEVAEELLSFLRSPSQPLAGETN